MALRSEVVLPLDLAPVVWKRLVCERVTMADVFAVDETARSTLEFLEVECARGAEAVDALIDDGCWVYNFTTFLSDGTEVELVPGGRDKLLRAGDLPAFKAAVEEARLGETDAQAAAIREGLEAVVPEAALDQLTWEVLEELVCGVREVSVEQLKKVTEYESGYHATHPVVARFWDVMAEFTAAERSEWLRFTCGRARLPSSGGSLRVVIDPRTHDGRQSVDEILPTTSTCSYTFHLPEYTTKEAMAAQLRIAITCTDVDRD
mmetsp:Transcript_6953/g.24571  ORF Transcript_6953/g.24571 Transcript_6953/m.24571 type:complete len:262 (-) Transcript_6953:7-792(-)